MKYAFWPYDLFPYHLGAVIDEKIPNKNGDVYVPAYQGYVHPKFVLNDAEGLKFLVLLDDLKKYKKERMLEINDLCMMKLQKVFDDFGIKEPIIK